MLIALPILYSLLVALNLADGISTWFFVRPAHYQREANPVARAMFRRLGITAGIIVAEILWISFISVIYFLTWQAPTLQWILLILLGLGVLVFAYIVPGNIAYCLRLHKEKKEKEATKEVL